MAGFVEVLSVMPGIKFRIGGHGRILKSATAHIGKL